MIDLEDEDLFFPNTKLIRDLLESLNYKVMPISARERREPAKYRAICFAEWVVEFECVQQTNKAYYCMNKPTLTEEQSIFIMNFLYVCADYATFKEVLQEYINKE